MSGERATYASLRPFADPQAAPRVNQYIPPAAAPVGDHSDRTAALNVPLYPPSFKGQFKAFDEDVCEGGCCRRAT